MSHNHNWLKESCGISAWLFVSFFPPDPTKLLERRNTVPTKLHKSRTPCSSQASPHPSMKEMAVREKTRTDVAKICVSFINIIENQENTFMIVMYGWHVVEHMAGGWSKLPTCCQLSCWVCLDWTTLVGPMEIYLICSENHNCISVKHPKATSTPCCQ